MNPALPEDRSSDLRKDGVKVIFVDRDGVIGEFPGMGFYVTRREDFRFLPNAKEALALLTKAGYEILVISNQGCVARGLISQEDLGLMTQDMLKAVEAEGGKISGVFYCLHETKDQCECKKPKTGLFKEAARGRVIDFRSTFFIGDSAEDVEAGENVGCKKVLVLSGRTRHEEETANFPAKPDVIKKDVLEAAQWILANES